MRSRRPSRSRRRFWKKPGLRRFGISPFLKTSRSRLRKTLPSCARRSWRLRPSGAAPVCSLECSSRTAGTTLLRALCSSSRKPLALSYQVRLSQRRTPGSLWWKFRLRKPAPRELTNTGPRRWISRGISVTGRALTR